MRLDPVKAVKVQQIKTPTKELHCFLGMVTNLSKFSSNLSQKLKPLCDLLSTKNEWVWCAYQQKAFDKI